jgi:hypothetical protein
MTRTMSARVAGFTFLFYIAIGIAQMIASPDLPSSADMSARLAGMAQHATHIRVDMVLGLITGFTALTLGVALYGITRDEDHELALLGLLCRACEGASILVPTFATLGLLWLAAGTADTTDAAAAHLILAGFLLKLKGWNVILAATFFAVGSTIFCWLLLRARSIPAPLAWLGLLASVLLVVLLPLRLTAVLSDQMAMLMWIPMAAFEIPLGFWLLFKGVRQV